MLGKKQIQRGKAQSTCQPAPKKPVNQPKVDSKKFKQVWMKKYEGEWDQTCGELRERKEYSSYW